MGALSISDLQAIGAGLEGTVVEVASEVTGAPEAAWGDTFLYYDPAGDTPPERRFPFATIVRSDSDGAVSIGDRPDVFRLNVGVGRERFVELVGATPSAAAANSEAVDHTQLDTLLPHPWYAAQAWVSILNPGPQTAALATELIAEAHAREAARAAGRTR